MKSTEMRLLVIRTSSMGDVALTTPVLRAMSEQYPDVEIMLLTRPSFGPFFNSMSGLSLFFIEIFDRHKGFTGLLRLCKDISRTGKFDIVVDLHDVLRSKILRFLFRLKGVPVIVIEKGRGEKQLVISGKSRKKLKHSVERYSDAFARAGFPLSLTSGPWIIPLEEAVAKVASAAGTFGGMKIGVAPYARHKLKVWPEEYMLRLLTMILEKHKATIYLFGGKEDSDKLSGFQAKLPNSVIAVTDGLDEELALMSRLDFMIAMDSSNMHMAALLGVKVISVWGGTDPVTGFGAWRQPEEQSVRIPASELTCRPCTVYGKGECKRGDFACMFWLTPDVVFRKIDNWLSLEYVK